MGTGHSTLYRLYIILDTRHYIACILYWTLDTISPVYYTGHSTLYRLYIILDTRHYIACILYYIYTLYSLFIAFALFQIFLLLYFSISFIRGESERRKPLFGSPLFVRQS